MEISRDEFEFVWQFYEALRTIGVRDFPVTGESFEKGVKNMEQYVKSVFFEDEVRKISLFFCPTPFLDKYNRLEDEIVKQWLDHPVSLESVEQNKIVMKFLSSRGEKPEAKYIGVAKAFCDGSGVNYNLAKVEQ